jgi:polyhydroxyalkanoate synthesis regulator phasin
MDDDDKGLLDRLKERGEEVFTQLSGELMSNRHFVKAMEGAMRGKQKLDEAAAKALKSMNVPTRTEFKKAVSRIEVLEEELAALRARARSSAAKAPSGRRSGKAAVRKKPAK